jgi:hypothetical protein
MDKVQDQGFVPSVIAQTRRPEHKLPRQKPGETIYYDPINEIIAIFNDAGQLITTYPKEKKRIK